MKKDHIILAAVALAGAAIVLISGLAAMHLNFGPVVGGTP